MKISVKNILDRIPGTSDTQEVLFPHRLFSTFLGEDRILQGDVTAVFEAMKVPEGVLGRFLHLSAEVERPCDSCGVPCKEVIADMETGWRSFVWKRDEEYEGESLEDVFLIDRTEGSVQLDECLRQELILSLAPQMVCASCEQRGRDLLTTSSPQNDQDNPFAGLKNLLK